MKINYSTLIIAALALVACNKEKLENGLTTIPDDQKEQISFSMSDDSGVGTKAGFTGADTRIVARFQSDATDSRPTLYTKTFLKAKVQESTKDFSKVEYLSGNTRYWDDAYGRSAKISVYAVAIPNSQETTKLTDNILAGNAAWSPEDPSNNNITLSVTTSTQTTAILAAEDLVYSNNIQSTGKNGRYVWNYTSNPEGYPADNGSIDGHSDGQLVFTQKSGAQASDAGHFDKGHMMFNHSLSRLTITLVEGAGFNSSSTDDFKFTYSSESENKNIKLIDLPTAGSLNIATGVWTISTSDGVKTMSTTNTTTAAAGTYSAQILPTYKFYENGTTNVMTFVIDDNQYWVTQGQIYTALNTTQNTTANLVVVKNDTNGNYIEMEQGKNYTLSITVNKTAINNVTATLAPWVEVAGSASVNNAHISLTLNTTGATCDKDIDLYRLGDNDPNYAPDRYDFTYKGFNWFGNYTDKTTLSQSGKKTATGGGVYWETPWFFESNKTYYHFRTVNSGTTVEGNADSTNDYFEISAGAQASTDPHWGAPMRIVDGKTWLKYSDTEGYKDHLYWAIGATESQIKIQELHMMSNINVILQTPNDGSKVQLYKPAVLYANVTEYNTAKGTSLDETEFNNLSKQEKTKEAAVGTIIKITRLAKDGKVEMGRGLVTPCTPYTDELTMTSPSIDSATDYYETDDTKSKTYTYAVVPQSLSRDFASQSDNDFVGIFIQTPDHNQYYVVKKLSEITATTVSDQRNQTQGAKIQRWFPGHTYTYTFTISKTGIQNVTCSVADWVTVTGQDTKIDLES